MKRTDPFAIYASHKRIFQKRIVESFCLREKRTIFGDANDMKYLTAEYPIVLSTTFSSIKALGWGSGSCLYDYVIMDESSQVDVITGVLALSCAKNAVIAGDKKQLPNVIDGGKERDIRELTDKCNIDDGHSYFNSFLSSVETVRPDALQTLLREHYRCNPSIIGFCNEQFYGGQLLVMKKEDNVSDPLEVIRT